VTEGGQSLDEIKGVRHVSAASGKNLVQIGSGVYQFRIECKDE
jgi:hypothetical protein